MRHQDYLCVGLGGDRQVTRLAGERLEHALDHLHHICFAFPQVGVLKLFELSHQHVHLHLEGPLRVAVLLLYHVTRR